MNLNNFKYYIFFLIVFSIACNRKEKKITSNEDKKIVILDTINIDTVHSKANLLEPIYQSIVFSLIDTLKDTLYCDFTKVIGDIPPPALPNSKIKEVEKDKYSSFLVDAFDHLYFNQSAKVQIRIDDKHPIYIFNFSSLIEISKLINGYTYSSFKHFPIYIINESDSIINLGNSRGSSFLVLQSKNKKGEWIDVEKKYFYGCGTGIMEIILPPNNIAVSKILAYEGDFKTKFRIKYLNNYSNIIDGSISSVLLENIEEYWKKHN